MAPRLVGTDDIETHVWERMVTVAHVWPGITPFNVWQLPLHAWIRFAAAADRWVAAQEREG